MLAKCVFFFFLARICLSSKLEHARSDPETVMNIFVLVIMKLSGFFHRNFTVNFSRSSRFTISLVSVHRKINR